MEKWCLFLEFVQKPLVVGKKIGDYQRKVIRGAELLSVDLQDNLFTMSIHTYT